LPDDRWRRCDIKTINLLPNILAAKKAKQAGCIEALLVRDGNAAECTASNAWRVKDGVVYTEPLSPLILRGISRTRLIDEIAPSVGVKVVEQHSSLQDFYDADEVFITSCTKLVLPVTKVDDVVIGDDHPISDKLFFAYADVAIAECGPIDKERI
ncbi:MAG: aminotransferase class IV, partial [Eubacteriales bacterium]